MQQIYFISKGIYNKPLDYPLWFVHRAIFGVGLSRSTSVDVRATGRPQIRTPDVSIFIQNHFDEDRNV